MAYAKGTTVPVDRSKAAIEAILRKNGADQFMSGTLSDHSIIGFKMQNRLIQIEMPLPVLERNVPSWQQKKGRFYSESSHAQEIRRRYRAMLLYVKAKLESVESGIVSFEEAFLAHVVLPNQKTVGQMTLQEITKAYQSGEQPKLLGGY